jgi:hypothetical protein
MKSTSTTIKPPKRSSSLVTKLTRTIFEQPLAQSQRSTSPSSSFSSSILTRGMSERMTSPIVKSNEHSSKKSNHRRTIDFSRRRTITGTSEQMANKENLSGKQSTGKSSEKPHRSMPTSSEYQVEIQPSSSKHRTTNKYYFHSHTSEDLLNNSYGLTLLKQQQQAQPEQQPLLQQRHSVAARLILSQIPKDRVFSQQSSTICSSLEPTIDSWDDLLCDREVESYFYPIPSSFESEPFYMNLGVPSNEHYPSSLDNIHGTLC